MIEIKVPATSANLGPGFDCIGMALKLYNNTKTSESENLEILSDNIVIPKDETNLIYKTMVDFYNIVGKKIENNFRIEQKDEIPLTRGLGSSAACIITGILAANHFSKAALSKKELAYIAAKIEGHPDNSTPALMGGVVVGALSENSLDFVKLESENIKKLNFGVMIPDFELSTEKARNILPKTYPIKDVVFNVSRASLLVAALYSGNFELISTAMDDRLHQIYRANIINNMNEIFAKAKDFGARASFLSGAGPTLISVFTEPDFFDKMKSYLEKLEDNWKINNIELDNDGAILKEI